MLLRNLFLCRTARKHIGKIASFGNGVGGLILHADMLGVAYTDPEGDHVYLSWANVKAIYAGPKVEESYRRCLEQMKARRETGPRPALTPEEISEMIADEQRLQARELFEVQREAGLL